MLTWRPKARQERLLVRELPGELLVYDLKRHKAHCLNETAAAVWKSCDGRRSVAEISLLVARGSGAEDLVLALLQDLQRRELMSGPMPELPVTDSAVSRRRWMRTAAMTAGLAVPLVSTVTAPTAAQAATCLPAGSACTTGAQCCSGVCTGGRCV